MSCTETDLVCVQGGPNKRSGTLGFRPDIASAGLQALVRLYYSSPQRLGYVHPALPNSFELGDGRTVVPKGRLVPLARTCHPWLAHALQAAHAIHFLAEKGQIHGDVSPYNICYQDGTATLLDLATLRSVDQVLTGIVLHHNGILLQSPS